MLRPTLIIRELEPDFIALESRRFTCTSRYRLLMSAGRISNHSKANAFASIDVGQRFSRNYVKALVTEF